MQRMHFQVRGGVVNCQQILTEISFVIVIFDIVVKANRIWFSVHSWNSRNDLGLTDMFLTSLNAEIVVCILLLRKSCHKPNLESTSKDGFLPIWREKNGGIQSMRMQVIVDTLFARRVQPLQGAGRKESLGTGLVSSWITNISRSYWTQISYERAELRLRRSESWLEDQ